MKQKRKKLTIKDLTKKELIELLDYMPLFKAFLHEERIAQIVMARKARQAESLYKEGEMLEKRARRYKSEKKRQHVLFIANRKYLLAKKRIGEVEALCKRFPIEIEKEACGK